MSFDKHGFPVFHVLWHCRREDFRVDFGIGLKHHQQMVACFELRGTHIRKGSLMLASHIQGVLQEDIQLTCPSCPQTQDFGESGYRSVFGIESLEDWRVGCVRQVI